MVDYSVADGPEFLARSQPLVALGPSIEERLRRAEYFLQLPSLVSYEQPLDEILSTLSASIVEQTGAVSAAINLVRPTDLATIALGYHNLPAGYLEGMQRARQSSEQGELLRQRARDDRSWVLRQAPAYMLSRPEYEHMWEHIRKLEFETLIGTAFLNRPDLIGFVFLYYSSDIEVDDDEVAFARALAEHARPLMDNAWHFRESERRRAEQEALARADQALHKSILLENVYQALIDLSLDLFGADRSLFLALDDQDRLHAHAARGIDETEVASLQEVYHSISGSQWREMPHVLGVMEDVQGTPTVNPHVLRVTTSASSVDIPVFVHGEPFGTFVIGYYERRTFTEDDRRLFETLSVRAGLAIQNGLLFAQSQRRANELDALYRADEALHRSLNLQDVLQAMVDLAVELLGGASSLVAIFEDDDRLGVVATRGIGDPTRAMLHERYRLLDRKYFEGRSIRSGTVEDVQSHPGLDVTLRSRLGGPGSLIEIPVVLPSGLFGIFGIGFARRRTFSDEDRRLFDTFGTRASLAIQNAILFEQAQVAASNEERERLARDLHDSVSQALYGIGLGARTLRRRLGSSADSTILEPVEYIASLAEAGLAETRALIFELIPESLANEGLVIALQRQAAMTQARSQIRVLALLADEPALPDRVKEALYRIAQESLNNMAKHSGASEAVMTLATENGQVLLKIQDDGKGFDTGGDYPGHFGLQSMAERARRCGATYLIESAPGRGTTVTAVVPLAV